MSVVELRKVGNRIHGKFAWDLNMVAKAKMVPGARWSPSTKTWTFPLDMEVCRNLRETFGSNLRIGNGLAAWARTAIKAEQEQTALASAMDAELQRVPKIAPVLAEAMSNRTYQRVAAQFIAKGRTVLIADEPGLGKTLETLAGLVELGARRVIVFAKKKAAETVWGTEVPRWLGEAAQVYVANGTTLNRQKIIAEFLRADAWTGDESETGVYKMRVLVCNIEMIRLRKGEMPKFPDLFRIFWDAVVVDESHNALIGKHTMSKNITQTRYGMMKLQQSEMDIRIALSGTPYRGKTQNLWGTLNWLRPDLFTSYWKYIDRYFETTKGYADSIVIGDLDPNMHEAHNRAVAPFLLRRTKGEVAKDMPPRQYGGWPLDPSDPQTTIGVWLPMDRAQAKGYAEVMAGAIKSDQGDITVNGLLAEMTRCKQFAVCNWKPDGGGMLQPVKPSNKYDWLLEFVQERAEAGLKVVVASQFTKVLNAFSCWLKADGVESYVLSGETTDKAATAIVGRFNDPSDPVAVCLINTKSGGESINLDACADDVVFLDETYIPDEQEQVENRVHRMSRIHQVNVWYVRSSGTIEEDICKITGIRNGAVKERLDGRRGVEYFRKIMEEHK